MRTRVWILRTHVRIIQGGCYHNASTWEAGTGSLGQGGQLTRRTWQALGSVRDPNSASIKKVEMKEDSQYQLPASSWVYTCVSIYTIYMQKLKLVLKKDTKSTISRRYTGQSEGTVSDEKEAQEQKQYKQSSHPRRWKRARNRGQDFQERMDQMMSLGRRC